MAETSEARTLEISEYTANSSARSIPAATSRVASPAWSVSESGSRGRTSRSRASSNSSVMIVRRTPMSVIRPALCEAIAARISGAPAMRSTSICACSLSRNCVHACPAASEASSRFTSCAISSLRHASVTSWLSMARSSARSTAGLRSARTIASSAAWLSARSAPVACATRPALFAPADSSRVTVGCPAPTGAGPAPFSDSAMVRSCTDPTGRTTGATTDTGSV